MADPGLSRTPPLHGWPRTSGVAAAHGLRALMGCAPDDAKALAAYEGLLELRDPSQKLAATAVTTEHPHAKDCHR